MLRSFLPPLHGFLLILRDSLTQVIRLGKGQLCLYITVLSLALEFGNALRVSEGQYREQTEKRAQQDMPSSSVGKGFCFHAQELTPEFAILPDRYRKRAIALAIWTVSDSGQMTSNPEVIAPKVPGLRSTNRSRSPDLNYREFDGGL